MESFRKAYGALKDSTKVGIAKVNSEFKDLDIAIVKATNHVESPPKERHIRRIFAAVSINRPRTDVVYCIHALSRRLAKTRNWIVAIKTLIVIHRTLREGDSSFREELLHYSQRGHLLQITNFKDDSSPLAWDCSAWVRTYALFIEERLECYRALSFDIETDRVPKSVPGISKTYSKTRLLNGEELLTQLPALQRLLYRLVSCQPEGAACYNFLVQYALALVLKESFKIYCSINDGIINLVDRFFEMPKHSAVRAFDIYKNAGKQAEYLADFYGFCRTLDLARTFQFPILRQPPPSFLATMEEYIKEAPQVGSLSSKKLEYHEAEQEPEEPEEPNTPQEEEAIEEKDEAVEDMVVLEEESETEIKEDDEPTPVINEQEPVDLLGLNEINAKAVEIEQSNALALAILQPGDDDQAWAGNNNNNALVEIGKTSGWELAIVTAPSNTSNPQATTQAKMAGGFDNLLLNSLYEDEATRRTLQLHSAGYNTSYGYEATQQNLFNQQNQQQDPFALSSNVAPPTNVQMALMSQQEQMMMMATQQQQQQQMMMMMMGQHNNNNNNNNPYQYHNNYNNSYMGQYYPQNQMVQVGGVQPNPFGDPFSFPGSSMHHQQGNNGLI